MKKIDFFNLTILIICLVGLNIYGQRKEISREDYFTAYQKAEENTKNFSYRIVTEGKKYRENEANLVSIGKGLEEFIPPYNMRVLWEEKVNGSNEVSSVEIITINGRRYKRENSGYWMEDFIPGYEQLPKKNFWAARTKYYLTKNVELAGKTADIYEITVESELVTLKPKKLKGKKQTMYQKAKYWISPEGLWLRVELNDKSSFDNEIISHRISTYEYTPKIKIETPIINDEQKITN